MYATLDELENALRTATLKLRGSSQLWHEAEIDGYHLYIADSSFGYGPTFRFHGNGRNHAWGCETGVWEPLFVNTDDEALAIGLELASRANWTTKLKVPDDTIILGPDA